LSVHENKRKRDDNVQPPTKRQRLSSAVDDCPKDDSATIMPIVGEDADQHREKKTTKRSRLYLKRRRKQRKVNFQNVDCDAPCITPSTNGKVSTGNEADEMNLHIGINGSLTDFVKQVMFVIMILINQV